MLLTNSKPIATPEQFKKALLVLRDKHLPSSHFNMLRAQCRSPETKITSTQLAAAANYENYNAANLQYGTLAFNVAGALGFTPHAQRADGSLCWWTTLAISEENQADESTGHFQFIMRPELATALREVHWA